MSTGIWSAASGAVAETTVLDIAANNIANASTPGFRADRAIFRRELAKAVNKPGAAPALQYSLVRTVEPDMTAGNIVSTGRPLDVALRGSDGFFVVRTPNGDRYTRSGSLRVASDGSITTPDGLPYVGPDRKIVKVSAQSTVTISNDGSLIVDGSPTNSKLLVVGFDSVRGLEKEGQVLLKARPEAGRSHTVDANLEVGGLEMSNANALGGMDELVTATRHFDMLSRVIDAFSATDRKAATDIMGKT
ncbi:MAG TPA: flagellar hook-basal body protein [Polyangiaceae bacterium]|nr:flagellar hook-basal body protein [Polyangiaceae bacterium]